MILLIIDNNKKFIKFPLKTKLHVNFSFKYAININNFYEIKKEFNFNNNYHEFFPDNSTMKNKDMSGFF